MVWFPGQNAGAPTVRYSLCRIGPSPKSESIEKLSATIL